MRPEGNYPRPVPVRSGTLARARTARPRGGLPNPGLRRARGPPAFLSAAGVRRQQSSPGEVLSTGSDNPASDEPLLIPGAAAPLRPHNRSFHGRVSRPRSGSASCVDRAGRCRERTHGRRKAGPRPAIVAQKLCVSHRVRQDGLLRHGWDRGCGVCKRNASCQQHSRGCGVGFTASRAGGHRRGKGGSARRAQLAGQHRRPAAVGRPPSVSRITRAQR